ncbi:hypothetical protein HAX54_015005 [Datura stramonium]|uniref:D-isomer specific 2-hydroxyacid dehydrogenase catalytic domain-containing protein n=1 Tax=Datura stramonium TaxID=4076 RepID=A0ABS8RZ72_DATST|nr:hypothetical protein [Datura stramonium]
MGKIKGQETRLFRSMEVDDVPLESVPAVICDYEICVVKNFRMNSDVLSRAKSMKLIMQFGVGLEGVDINATPQSMALRLPEFQVVQLEMLLHVLKWPYISSWASSRPSRAQFDSKLIIKGFTSSELFEDNTENRLYFFFLFVDRLRIYITIL